MALRPEETMELLLDHLIQQNKTEVNYHQLQIGFHQEVLESLVQSAKVYDNLLQVSRSVDRPKAPAPVSFRSLNSEQKKIEMAKILKIGDDDTEDELYEVNYGSSSHTSKRLSKALAPKPAIKCDIHTPCCHPLANKKARTPPKPKVSKALKIRARK